MTQPNYNKLFPTSQFWSEGIPYVIVLLPKMLQYELFWVVIRIGGKREAFTSVATRRSLVSAGRECHVLPMPRLKHFVKSRLTCL